jgi:penicillin G amidase
VAAKMRLAVILLTLLLALSSCALLRRPPKVGNLKTRIDELPKDLGSQLKGKTELRFNEHLVPYITSDNDEDAAFMLGVVHAHLRGFQLELLRRASQGRLSERLGAPAAKIDHALRIFDFGRASAKIEASMPTETRKWMEAFVRGINARWMREPRPFEFDSLGIAPEAWTLKDLITMSRLLAADVNWLLWIQALSDERPEARWKAETALAQEKNSWNTLKKIFLELSKSGSNSWVIASRRTENGAPLIANDPHVGLTFPNLWLLVGLSSPSFQVVGLSFPGIPFVLLGRNRFAAWGGTNMRAMSTEFYDVSKLPASAFTTRTEKLVIRAWPDRDLKIRETRFGPVLSDAKLFKTKKPFSVRWVGHEASDEFTAFYKMNQATRFEQFHKAFETYGVSAQNFLYADVHGDIAHILALRKPERSEARPPGPLVPAQSQHLWKSFTPSTALPYRFNPGENFLVSANDRPVFAPDDLGLVFAPSDRARRIRSLIEAARAPLTLSDLKRWQEDVYSADSLSLARRFEKIFSAFALEDTSPKSRESMAALKNWDGHWRADSRGALVYASLEALVVESLTKSVLEKEKAKVLLGSGYVRQILDTALENDPKLLPSEKELRRIWSSALSGDLRKFSTWGDKHEETLSHPFEMLPFVGSGYRFYRGPAAGSFDTLAKRAHSLGEGATPTSYGATARHVSDLSDPDANEFVLFGGQDGDLRSPASLSQLKLWREAKRIRLPLTPALIEKEFPLKVAL